MQKIILLFLISAIIAVSCKQSGNKTETFTARQYYDSISYYYNLTKEIHPKLIAEITQSLLAIKTNKNAIVDTKALQLLVDSAVEQNNSRIKIIEKIKEVDSDIDYKEKVLSYLKIFDSFYTNELQEYIRLAGKVNEDRFTIGSKLLTPKLLLIKEKQTDFENARDAFKEKYPLDKDGNIRVGPDYDLVKLSDYTYEQADMPAMEKVRLLSLSGHPDCDEDHIYYEQMIVVRESTGDTVRILSPCPATNLDKPQPTGYFLNGTSNNISSNATESNSFVVFNKHLSELENRKFKTTIGIVVFQDLKDVKL